MTLYRDQGVVLRTHKLGESDRIITLLTRHHGLVRAVARGVRKTTSRFGARLEPFMHGDLQIAEGRSLDVVSQVVTIDPFGSRIGGDYAQYTAGTAMLETAAQILDEDTESSAHYLLLVGGLNALVRAQHDPGVILDSYQLRALSIAGYAPTFDTCAQCEARGPHRSFHAPSGGMLCDRCRVPGASAPSPLAVALLGALLAGDWPVIDTADERSRREASAIVGSYLSWHLERSLRSLRHVDR